ncbi:MAG: VWA domain-containing protein, partial [Candidatus Binatia bacterium]
VVEGSITYDLAGRRYRHDYPDRSHSEIFKFGPLGATASPATRYELGASCERGCRAISVAHAMPVLTNDPAVYLPTAAVPAFGDCAAHAPIDAAASPIRYAWFRGDGTVCRARWTDDAEYTFSAVTAADLTNSLVFDEPEDCSGGERLDLLVMIDRSASVTSVRFEAARVFVADFLRSLAISPSQANIAIATFDIDLQLAVALPEGTSDQNVASGLASLDCTCADTLDPTLRPAEIGAAKVPTCCGRRTSLAAALDAGSDYLTTAGRGNPDPTRLTRKALLVITDGKPNTLRDGVTPCKGAVCREELYLAVEEARQAHAGLEIFGLRLGKTPKQNRRYAFGGRPRFQKFASILEAPATCSAGDACDASSCDGLCACGECTPPSACDPSDDYCQVRRISATVCELVPRDCSLEFPNLCDAPVCNPTTQLCEARPVECPASSDPFCFDRECSPNTGICTTTVSSDRNCVNDHCELDAECDDGNACTQDTCRQTDTVKACDYTPLTCDDGDICTIDYCSDTEIGCQHRPRLAGYCDDGLSCTLDTCVPFAGCRHTPLPCDDGQSCTTDVCDPDTGRCVHGDATCPDGTTSLLGACWVRSQTSGGPSAGAGEGCDAACDRVGLGYDEATRAVAGSDGTDSNCLAVLAALGLASGALEYPSSSCGAALGCFASPFLFTDTTPFEGRCDTPPTDAIGSQPWGWRACACR